MAKNDKKRQRQLEKKRRKQKEKKNRPTAATRKTTSARSIEENAISGAVGAPPFYRELVFARGEEPSDELGLTRAELELFFYETQVGRRKREGGVPVCLIQIEECLQIEFPTLLAGGLAEVHTYCVNPKLWRIRLKMHEYVDPDFDYGKWLLRQQFVNPKALAGESMLTTSFPMAVATARPTKRYLPCAERFGLQVDVKREEVVFWECPAIKKGSDLNELQVDRFWEVLMFVREHVRLMQQSGSHGLERRSILEAELTSIEEEEVAAKANLTPAFDALQMAEVEIEALREQRSELQTELTSGAERVSQAQAAVPDPNEVRTLAANARAHALQTAARGDTVRAEELMAEHRRLLSSVGQVEQTRNRLQRDYRRVRDQWLLQQPKLLQAIEELTTKIKEKEEELIPFQSAERKARAVFDSLWWRWQKVRYQLDALDT